MSRIPLPQLPTALRELCGEEAAITYSTVYRRVVDGVIPAQRSISNRLTVNRADLPLIAKRLGFTPSKRKQA